MWCQKTLMDNKSNVSYQLLSPDLSLCEGAVQRKYESMRRQWVMEGKENSTDLAEAHAKVNKYRARRIRVSSSKIIQVLHINSYP